MFKKILIGVVVLIFGLVLFASCGSSGTETDSGTVAKEEQVKETEKASLDGEIKEITKYGSLAFEGLIKNNTDKELSYIEIEIMLYDKNDVQVDTAYTNTTNLKAGGSWKFEALTMEDNVDYDYYEYQITAY